MGTTTSSPNHEPLGRTGRSSFHHGRSSFRSPTKDRGGVGGPRRMDRLRRSLRDSFRRRKEHVPESSKPHMWQADEAAVRAGTCNFNVKYLGCVEVFESRGMQVCEEALKVLRNSRRRPVKATLYVSGDGLRVVEDETKGLIVDQTIEKVSFCAPDRNHDKGFSYICRDGTTRRWMCHGFLALKESGERLSHAVGCAFAACLERKQKRDKECGVTMTFDHKNSTFTRTGSFRQASITERLQDPQECKPTGGTDWDSVIEGWKQDGIEIPEPPPPKEKGKEPPPVKPVHNPFAIERPHATPSMLERQGSFRGFQTLNQASPFKRQMSLRLSDLPSTLERQRSLSLEGSDLRAPPRPAVVAASGVCLPANTSPQPPPRTQRNRLHSLPNAINMSPIPEASPVSDKTDPVSAMCQQLSQGLSLLSSADDPFPPHPPERPGQQVLSTHSSLQTNLFAAPAPQPVAPLQIIDPIKFHNPWMNDPKPKISTVATSTINQVTNTATTCTMSWGNMSVTSSTPAIPASTSVSWGTMAVASTTSANDTTEVSLNILAAATTDVIVPEALPKPDQWLGSLTASPVATSNGIAPIPPRRAPHLSHLRAHSLGSADYMGPTKQGWKANDPFDAEWANIAAKSQASTNPFAQGAVKAFEVQM